ncbi:MAG: nitronate monooxygenase [Alphaproteobacteria bacterium]
MINTALCDQLGIELPIIQAPLGPDLSGAALAAAVSDAGGLGTLQAQLHPPAAFRAELEEVRRRTSKPFAVNFILHFPCEDAVAICLEEGVPALSFFWGDPAPFVRRAHAAGAKVIHQVGSVAAARRAADARGPAHVRGTDGAGQSPARRLSAPHGSQGGA